MSSRGPDLVPRLTRRDLLRGLATVPVLAAFGAAASKHASFQRESRQDVLGFDPGSLALGSDEDTPRIAPAGPTLSLGVIGVGLRGKQLMVAAGFAQPDQLGTNERLGTDGEAPLNVRIAGVCDLYRPNLEWGLAAAGGTAVAYRRAEDLLASPAIDAVVIATPDRWHAPLVIAAARAGKHVYVEKCFSRDVEGAVTAADAVRRAGVVLQLGHQGRQNALFAVAADLVRRGALGPLRLVQAFTNRNGAANAWAGPIPEGAGPNDVDWAGFQAGDAERPFDADRFFHWRKYWDYGTSLSGDLFTHEWDAIDFVLGGLGIPASAIASGGVYHWKDGRETPDVYQVAYEYPERGLTLVYDATLANGWRRDKLFLGADATMNLTDGLRVYADRDSTRYAVPLRSRRIEAERPILTYLPGGGHRIDAVTSATQEWAVARGLLYTAKPSGRLVSTAYLHLREWLDAIRSGTRASCHEDLALTEAVTAHMGTQSLRWGCRVRWDAESRRIVPDLQAVPA